MTRIYRIQDVQGRGPFKPGHTRLWADPTKISQPIGLIYQHSLTELRAMMREKAPDLALGFGCRSFEQLTAWFTVSEFRRLDALGYMLAAMDVDVIVAENKNEVLFGRALPLNSAVATESLLERPL